MTLEVLDPTMERRRSKIPTLEDLQNGAMPLVARVGVLLKTSPESRRREPDLSSAARIMARFKQELAEEDKKYNDGYKIEGHSVGLAEKVVAMGDIDGCSDMERTLRSIIPLGHDVGKRHPLCRLYRKGIVLNWWQRWIVGWHAHFSGKRVRAIGKELRREDRQFLKWIYLGIRWHHKFWRIFFIPWLRQICCDTMIADMYQAMTEDRPHRSGYTRDEALRELPMEIRRKIPLRWRIIHAGMIETSISRLKRLPEGDIGILA